jgi:hypothetical protein
MNYPEVFRVKVKLIYPNNNVLLMAIENGSPFVGKMLEQYSQESISNEEILNAADLNELQTKAQVIKAKRELYKLWLSISITENAQVNSEKISD